VANVAKIYLIRHAPTAANASGVFQGQSDVPAEPIADPKRHAIPAAEPRTIYTSPLQRARTAAGVLFPGERTIVDDRLMERSVGEWEGLDHATVRRRWPAYGEQTTDLMLTPPGGESLDEFARRVKGFLLDLGGATDNSYVMTHSGWIRMALMLNCEIALDELFAEPVPFLVPISYTS
jgi:broad specificity phosphatase PhoE